jgi:hypothetical protein
MGKRGQLWVSPSTKAERRRLRKQTVHIRMAREHCEAAVSRARPLLLRPVPMKLHAIVVGITEIDGFADAVV